MSTITPDRLHDALKSFFRSAFAKNRKLQTKGGECSVLIELIHNQGGLKPSDIGQNLNISPSSVTPILNSLEDKNLIERIYSKTDRRTACVVLTEQGRVFVKDIIKQKSKEIQGLIDYLGEEESETFTKLLIKSANYFKEIE